MTKIDSDKLVEKVSVGSLLKYQTTTHTCQCMDKTMRGGSHKDANGNSQCKHILAARKVAAQVLGLV